MIIGSEGATWPVSNPPPSWCFPTPSLVTNLTISWNTAINSSISIGAPLTINETTFTVGGDLQLGSGGEILVTTGSWLFVSGNLVLEAGSLLNLSSSIVVSGCLNISSAADLWVNVNVGSNITITYGGCRNGSFSDVQGPGCPQIFYRDQSVVIFGTGCGMPTALAGSSLVIILGVCIPVALAIVALVVALKIPRLRKMVFPYRDRNRHQFAAHKNAGLANSTARCREHLPQPS